MVCLVKVLLSLISSDSSPTREESLDLMEDVAEAISMSTAALFEEYMEDLLPFWTPLASSALVHKWAYARLNL